MWPLNTSPRSNQWHHLMAPFKPYNFCLKHFFLKCSLWNIRPVRDFLNTLYIYIYIYIYKISLFISSFASFSSTNWVNVVCLLNRVHNDCEFIPHEGNHTWLDEYRVHYESNAHFLGKIYLLILSVQMLKILRNSPLLHQCTCEDVSATPGRHPETPPQECLSRTL